MLIFWYALDLSKTNINSKEVLIMKYIFRIHKINTINLFLLFFFCPQFTLCNFANSALCYVVITSIYKNSYAYELLHPKTTFAMHTKSSSFSFWSLALPLLVNCACFSFTPQYFAVHRVNEYTYISVDNICKTIPHTLR